MSEKNKNLVRDIMVSVLGLTADQVDEYASSETIESWDSLKHMSLVVSLEEEFDIEFDEEEILTLTSLPEIMATLSKKAGV